jgi:uncharacterized protein YjeT (DUF2065 family)
LLAAQELEIKVTSLLGLSGDQARVFGGFGLVIGAVIGLGVIIDGVTHRKMPKEPA